MLCPTHSVFPFVSSSELWAEFIMANRNVFADGETGTERLEIVTEIAALAPKTHHRKGNGPSKRFRLSTFQVCQTIKAAHFSSIAVMDHRIPCAFVHRLLHAWTGRHWSTQDFEISREAPGLHLSPWRDQLFFKRLNTPHHWTPPTKDSAKILGDATHILLIRFGSLGLQGNSAYCRNGKSGPNPESCAWKGWKGTGALLSLAKLQPSSNEPHLQQLSKLGCPERTILPEAEQVRRNHFWSYLCGNVGVLCLFQDG